MAQEANEATKEIIGAAIAVHRELGPGLLESVYEACLAYELEQRGMEPRRQVALPVQYRGVSIEAGFRLDIVAGPVAIELKSVDRLLPLHQAQVLTYLRLSGFRLGLLINFGAERLLDGLRRFVR